MKRDVLKADLIEAEGCVLHAYRDSQGFLTLGIGRLIDDRRGGGISKAEALVMLDNDIRAAELACQDKLGFWHRLGDVRQRALVEMCFQLGIDGLLGFVHMLSAIQVGNWQAAHDEALASRWARQTPARARRIAHRLLTGVSV